MTFCVQWQRVGPAWGQPTGYAPYFLLFSSDSDRFWLYGQSCLCERKESKRLRMTRWGHCIHTFGISHGFSPTTIDTSAQQSPKLFSWVQMTDPYQFCPKISDPNLTSDWNVLLKPSQKIMKVLPYTISCVLRTSYHYLIPVFEMED